MDESNNLIESKWSHTDVSDLTGKKFYVCTSTIQEPFITSRYNLMPWPSTDPKMSCAVPNILSQSKNIIAFSAFSKILCWQKTKFTKCKSSFGAAQNVLGRTRHKYLSFLNL